MSFRRILVVTGDVLSFREMCALLAFKEIELTNTDVASAVQAIHGRECELVIVDIESVGSGAVEILAAASCAGIPTIAFTAEWTVDLSLLPDLYAVPLGKPLEPRDFEVTVDHFLARCVQRG